MENKKNKEEEGEKVMIPALAHSGRPIWKRYLGKGGRKAGTTQAIILRVNS